jgi:hypothetical protein
MQHDRCRIARPSAGLSASLRRALTYSGLRNSEASMPKKSLRLPVFLVLAAFLLAGCQAAPAGEPLNLKVVHTNDTWGYTQPCG